MYKEKMFTKEYLTNKGFIVATEGDDIFLYNGVSYNIKINEDRLAIMDILNEIQEQEDRKYYPEYEEIEIETVEHTIINDKEVKKGREKPLEEVVFPLVSHNEILQDKKIPYNTYATLMINSKFDKDSKENYIYEKNIWEDVMDFLEELERDGAKIVGKKTIERHIKVMLDNNIPLLEVQNTPNGIEYIIKSTVDNGYYVKVPYMQVRELLISTNKNMLKLFVFLKVMCKEDKFKPIDRKFIAEHIGLSSNSDATLKGVGTMLNSLAKLGFIEIQQTIHKEADEKGNKIVKTINSYRIRTIEEYKDITDRANGKKK